MWAQSVSEEKKSQFVQTACAIPSGIGPSAVSILRLSEQPRGVSEQRNWLSE